MATNEIHVLLTGASSGIGLETARLLSARGCTVWGTSRDAKRLPAFPNFHPVVMDLTNLKSIREGFSRVLTEAVHLDVLINNAGAGDFGPMELQTGEIVREQFELMVYGPLELIRLALPLMRQHGKGRIINVSSLAGRFAVPFLGPYSAAKAALISLSQSLRLELANTGIHVIDLQPGDINTNFHQATRRLQSTLGKPDQPGVNSAWQMIERNMAAAPHPQLAAEGILRIITQLNPPPVVTVGNIFQARLGPVLARFAPPRLVEWALRRYYRIGG
jgi:short-subunit dehydrogenase